MQYTEGSTVFFLVIFVVSFASALGCWCLVAVSLVGVVRNFKDGSDRFSRQTLWNPINALANARLLNDRGLQWRRRVFGGGLGFLGSCAIGTAALLCLRCMATNA